MKIYPNEEHLKDQIAKASTEYCTQLVEAEIPSDAMVEEMRKVLASEVISQKDLYPLTSILVTTRMNKNDDYFDPQETWAAKDSPKHKPFNYGHNENEIIGHIIGNYVIDTQNKIVSNETDASAIPEDFHIVTPSVLYKHWESPKLKARTKDIIEKVKAGTLFVSMEALFDDFDYILYNTTEGTYQHVPRNENTSFLTKYLRCYGGRGVYNNCKIGRYLKGITFCGKGMVENPANVNSIIFAEKDIPHMTKSSALYVDEEIVENPNNIQETVMAEINVNDLLAKQLESAQANVASLADEKIKLTIAAQEAKSKLEISETKASDLSAKLTEAESKLSKANDEIVALKAKFGDSEKDKDEMKKKHDEMKAKCAELQAELDNAASAAKTSARTEYVKANLKKDDKDAGEMVKTYASFDDAQFKLTIDTLKSAMPAKAASVQPDDILNSVVPNGEVPMNTKAASAESELDKLGALLAENLGKTVASLHSAGSRNNAEVK